MSKLRILAIIFILSSDVKCQFLWQIFPDTFIQLNYYDGDEFNKPKINTDKWHTGFPWSRASVVQETYLLENNLELKDGKLNFVIKKEDVLYPLYESEIDTAVFRKNKIELVDGNKYRFKFTSGLLWSRKNYQYGYFELKFKGPPGKGIWPAFWLYGGKPNYEIDFFELKGEEEKRIHVDVHCPDGCSNYKEGMLGYRRSWGHWVDCRKNLKDGFNVLAGEWTKDQISWYLNGDLIAFYPKSITMPMALTVGTGVAKHNAPFGPGPDKQTPFPNYFVVDYLRVFRSDSLPNYNQLQSNLSSERIPKADSGTEEFVNRKSGKKLKFSSVNKKKSEKILTISVIPLSSIQLELRILGVAPEENVEITFRSPAKDLIKTVITNVDKEVQIPIGGYDFFQIQITARNQSIVQKIPVLH